MIFRTETGSKYELDTKRHRIRRLHGTHPPTANQGPDGEWRDYVILADPEGGNPATTPIAGHRLLIIWGVDADPQGRGVVVRRTVTSLVVKTEEEPHWEHWQFWYEPGSGGGGYEQGS